MSFFFFLFFLGQWIFQLPEVDFGERPNRLGHEVYYWWRAVWTGLLNVLVFFFVPTFNLWRGFVSVWLMLHFLHNRLFRLTSMTWNPMAQRLSSPMKTRMNISSKKNAFTLFFFFLVCVSKCSLMLTCHFVINSLVIQWRFVNRIQKQMTAFKEVNSGFVFFKLVKHGTGIKDTHWYTLCFRDSLSWYRKIWSRSLMRMSSRWVFSWSNWQKRNKQNVLVSQRWKMFSVSASFSSTAAHVWSWRCGRERLESEHEV